MRTQHLMMLGLAGCLTTACTTSLTSVSDGWRPSKKPTDEEVVPAGIPYQLAALEVEITLAWRLAGCGNLYSDGSADIEVDASALLETRPVPGKSYLIDYSSLASGSKTTLVNVTYHPGTHVLKSVNATVEDKGPEILGSLMQSGFSVLRLALGLPSAPGAVETAGANTTRKVNGNACDDPALRRLAARKSLEEGDRSAKPPVRGLADVKQDAEALTKEAERLQIIAALGALSESDKQRLRVLGDELAALEGEKEKLSKAIALIDRDLTLTRKVTLPITGTTETKALPKDWRLWRAALVGSVNQDSLEAATAVVIRLRDLDPNIDSVAPSGKHKGILYRQSEPGLLTVCMVNAPATNAKQGSCDPTQAEVLTKTLSVPQFGAVRRLPLSNGFGEKNGIEATFAADGSLLTFKFGNETASGVAVANAVGVGVKGAADLDAAIRADNAAQRKRDAEAAAAEAARPLAEIEARTKMKKAQLEEAKATKELADFQAALAAAKPADQALDDARQAIDDLAARPD